MPIDVVFFDAAGTLFETSRRVGEIYAEALKNYGVVRSAEDLDHRFRERFALQPPLAFDPALDGSRRLELEFSWWRQLVGEVVSLFPGFDECFAELFDYFRHANAWRVFDDSHNALEQLRKSGFKLGVISNFDSRLDDVLRSLDLMDYFDSVTISSRAGYAKPHPEIFRAAASNHDAALSACLHVGDSFLEDFRGASGAGMHACWLDRASRI